jgi:hypothetical protein
MARITNAYRSDAVDCIIVQRSIQHEQGNAAKRVVLQRREQDTAGDWHTSMHFKVEDIPDLIDLLSRAHHALTDGEPAADRSRPVDLDLTRLDIPETHEIHNAILASQIRR